MEINKKSIYIFLGSCNVCSLFISGLFIYILSISLIILCIINRGLFYTLRANKYFSDKNIDKGYKLLGRAYKAGVPLMVTNGYIYLSLKYGYYDIASEAIEKILSGNIHFKIKDGHKNMILSQKALYLWKTGDIDSGIDILEQLYLDGYRTSSFYGNFGYLLHLRGDLERAEKICLEAYDYGKTDKVTLDNLVAIYLDSENWLGAKKYFEELTVLEPNFAEAYYHGALLALHYGNIEEAKSLLKKTLSYELFFISSINTADIDSLKDKIEAK